MTSEAKAAPRKVSNKYKGRMVESSTAPSKLANVLVTAVVSLGALICLLPMWHVVMSSVSDGFTLLSHKGIAWMPVGQATLDGYRLIFRDRSVAQGYLNTILYVAGTVGVGFVINVIGGYCLSRNTRFRGAMTTFLLITMMFSGGMIPTYMVFQSLGLVGSRWAIILQEATMAMYVIIAGRAFASVPQATVESAELEGAGHLRVMFQIMFPQCRSLFMVTILNTFVAAWNSWLTASIYMSGDKTKWPVQLVVNELINNNQNFLETSNPNYSRYLVQFAAIVISTAPVIAAFLYFQKEIEAGVIEGGVKG